MSTARSVGGRGAIALAACFVAACAPKQAGPPMYPEPQLDAQGRRGQEVYMRFCDECHPNGQAGRGPGIVDRPLPDAAIKAQVRLGAGIMPSFSEEQISDEDLDALVVYLEALEATADPDEE